MRKSESAGPGQISASRQLGSSPLKPFGAQHAALEAGHPLDRRRVGQVGGFDADVELAGDAGRRPAARSGSARRGCPAGRASGCRTSVSIWVPSAPADDGQGAADAQDSSGVRQGQGQEALRRAGPVTGGGACGRRLASVLGPPPVPPARGAASPSASLPTQAEGGEAGGEGEDEGDRDADEEEAGRSSRTIGVGESWRARKPAAVARQAVAIVGAAGGGGRPGCVGAG